MIATLLSCLAVALGLAMATWVVSRLSDDASIVDILWGMFFVAMTLTAALAGDLGSGGRKTLLLVLVTLWGVRLSGYLAFVVALPLLLALGSSSSQPVGLVAVAGVALWAVGLFFETVGDWQLARFKARPDSAGQVMAQGLWKYARHPNYFGDFCVWWGLLLVAAETGVALFGIVGPILMTVLLTRVSGKDLLERTIGRRRPGYADYIARTSGFFPRRPTYSGTNAKNGNPAEAGR